MAKGKVNKSAEVRRLLDQNPDISAKDIVSTLARRRIKVTPSFVYTIKSKASPSQGPVATPKAKPKAPSRRRPASNPAEAVMKVKKLADDLGGLKDLKQLVDAIAD